jgi:hypothetical protein
MPKSETTYDVSIIEDDSQELSVISRRSSIGNSLVLLAGGG